MSMILDHEKQIKECEKTISELKAHSGLNSEREISQLEQKLLLLKQKVYANLTAWQRISICRHPARPRSVDYIKAFCKDFTELHGDRAFRDDSSIIAGLCYIGRQKFMVVAQEKGCDTESRLKRNFGMPHPEGYRKALRCMQMAEKFGLPVLTLVDTPGAFAGLAAEERGQGWAIAKNLLEMADLSTPIISVLIGEGCSGGALGIAVADKVAMLRHSYYSVITPEGCASILWKDSQKKELAASYLKLHAEELMPMGIIDAVIEEPLGGAHHNAAEVFENVESYILSAWEELKVLPLPVLKEERYQKFRKIGKFAVEDKASL